MVSPAYVDPQAQPIIPKWISRTGWAISALVAVAFGMSGGMKLKGGPGPAEMMDHIGLSPDLAIPLGLFEVVCVVLYLVPATSVLAAILFTGYLGGAICSHLRLHEPFVTQSIIGVVVWLGVFFRDYRLRQLIPLRNPGGPRP